MWFKRRLPLPSTAYMELVCSKMPNLEKVFLDIGVAQVRMLDDQEMLRPGTDFLDIGCGCGRLARCLMDRRLKSYTGFDRHAGMIKWCRDEITKRAPNFRFDFFDIESVYQRVDEQRGAVSAATFLFPYPDRAFDSVMLASVFTHMPLEEAAHYLEEIRRVIRPGGKVMLSAFFSEKEPYLDEINYFYPPDGLLAEFARTGFRPRRLNDVCYGTNHNWFVLTPA